jgi:heme exporter protein D
MTWTSIDHFLSMNGHGLFVWGSYALALVLMVAEPLWARARHRRALRDAAQAARGPAPAAAATLRRVADRSPPLPPPER